ncbi:MAG: hypothetical protein ACRDCY_17270 [Aeromonas veronii]
MIYYSEKLFSGSPYAGNWIATFPQTGATVANIRIDGKDQVWVNDKQVNAKKSDGALVFKDGMVIYTIQGDRRIKGEDGWVDNISFSSQGTPAGVP